MIALVQYFDDSFRRKWIRLEISDTNIELIERKLLFKARNNGPTTILRNFSAFIDRRYAKYVGK